MNETIAVNCPACDKKFTVSKSHIGKKAKCPCSNVFTVEFHSPAVSISSKDEISKTSNSPVLNNTDSNGSNKIIVIVAVIAFSLGIGVGFLISGLLNKNPKTNSMASNMQPKSPPTSFASKEQMETGQRQPVNNPPKQRVVARPQRTEQRQPVQPPPKQRMPIRPRSNETIPIPDAKKSPSMEKVNLFPDRYLGQKLVFAGCKVNQELKKNNNTPKTSLYIIAVTSNGGQYMGSYPSDDDITFAVQENMAEKLSNDIKGGYSWYDCVISCVILNIEGDYYAVIDGIDIYNMGGTVGRKYR